MGRHPKNNKIQIELDPENDSIKLESGASFYLDTSYEPEKHQVRTGIVKSVPEKLFYKKGNQNSMPWKTNVDVKVGDRVVMYYLAVMNCLSKERRWFYKENEKTYIFIDYNNIYATITDNNTKPINGYVLVEPIEDPNWTETVEKCDKAGLIAVNQQGLSKTHVTYGKIAYLAPPLEEYYDDHKSDDFIDVKVGDTVILKKVRDIPMEYEYHTKTDGGRKLFRMQRPDIAGIL